jgi:hypothetical protein
MPRPNMLRRIGSRLSARSRRKEWRMIAQTAHPRLQHGSWLNLFCFLFSHSPILHSRAVPCQRRHVLPWL